MTFKTITLVLASVATVFALAGCATTETVGSTAGDTPPRMVNNPNTGTPMWDHLSAFGPVPAHLAAKGLATCTTINTKNVQHKAIGYHPLAKDLAGNNFVGGGYLCGTK